MQARVVSRPRERRQRDALPRLRTIALAGERRGALSDIAGELLRAHGRVDEPPLLRALAADAVGRRAEDVGVVAPDFSLVGDAREAAGAGQHAEQRYFRQADRRRAVVDQDDLVARQRQLVATAG